MRSFAQECRSESLSEKSGALSAWLPLFLLKFFKVMTELEEEERKTTISPIYYHYHTSIKEPRLVAYLMVVVHFLLVAGYRFL
jgi:hypothetical protein